MKVEVLSVDGVRYVVGGSLFKAVGKETGNFTSWANYHIKKHKLVRGTDFINSGQDMLFSCEAAAKIAEHTREGGVKKDEYGLPILPPQKRRGALINPYRI